MTARPLRLGPGWATGVGSMPGVDPREAAAVVVGELPDLPHLPELPARGPGADLVGRTAALLVDLHADREPSGWRLVDRPGRDEHRAHTFLSADLDALEEAAADRPGPLKVQVVGPWTLLASLQLPRGEPALGDRGARRDVVASLAEGVAAHVADVRRRLPAADVLLQLDEPSLPAVLAGRIRSVSGLRTLAPPDGVEAEEVVRTLVTAAGCPLVVHCCADDPPVGLLHRAGAGGVSLDLTLPGADATTVSDELGEALEAGVVLLAGVVPALARADLSDPGVTVEPVRRLWRRLGLRPDLLAAGAVVVTPTCGLAGADRDRSLDVLRHCRAAAQLLADDPEG